MPRTSACACRVKINYSFVPIARSPPETCVLSMLFFSIYFYRLNDDKGNLYQLPLFVFGIVNRIRAFYHYIFHILPVSLLINSKFESTIHRIRTTNFRFIAQFFFISWQQQSYQSANSWYYMYSYKICICLVHVRFF